ncbi:flagellar basal body rod C-terminal domain-containing protein, partial [Pseudomonas aeruginosa]
KQAQDSRDSLSGVSLDEEAANLIQFQQYYGASAQVI